MALAFALSAKSDAFIQLHTDTQEAMENRYSGDVG
jgi:hypothetical protein